MSGISNQPYVIVPLGTHMLELLKYNPVRVVAAIDYRSNGALQKAGISEITGRVYSVGPESNTPFISIPANYYYYQRLASLIKELKLEHPNCRFILSANYTPVTRFIIDHAGTQNVELWEDGLNHYIRLESILKRYRYKEIIKLFAGFYRKGLFDTNYRGSHLTVRDRFKKGNLDYPVIRLNGDAAFYIGQPLIEDSLISEKHYRNSLSSFFAGRDVTYLPHPREEFRAWLTDIFSVKQLDCSAERYLTKVGAGQVYSAFSTVNVNIQCSENVFLTRYLGLHNIADKLTGLDLGVTLA